MVIEQLIVEKPPDQWPLSEYDCLWVNLKKRIKPTPLEGDLLQWIDWKLNGALSRFILEEGYQEARTVFVPTMKKTQVDLLALNCGGVNWESFESNCEGLKFKYVLLICESPSDVSTLVAFLKNKPHMKFPECVRVVADTYAGL